MNWVSVNKSLPRPYQMVEAKGVWKASKLVYLDDEDGGWEQKSDGEILVTHWRPFVKKKRTK